MSADPIRARRAQIARAAAQGQRIGYLLFLAAMVAFVIGFVAGFTDTVVTIVVAALIVGSVILAPSIVLGYAAKAAEREDRDRGL